MTEKTKGMWLLKPADLVPLDPEVEEWAKLLWEADHPGGSDNKTWPPTVYSPHEYRKTAAVIVAKLVQKELATLTEYDMHSEVGIKFQDLLADWACGKAGAFEVWDFVRDNITKEKINV
jgi:hypothetical protein